LVDSSFEKLNNPKNSKAFLSRSDFLGIPRIFIGRLATNDIQLTHRSISRRHCLIEVIDKYVYIVDLDSKFGTYLNDIKLSARERTLLRNNDEIVIGKGIETVKIIYIN